MELEEGGRCNVRPTAFRKSGSGQEEMERTTCLAMAGAWWGSKWRWEMDREELLGPSIELGF
jgi:hypothetical protein